MTFGSAWSLERIGDCCFAFSGVEGVSIPAGVRELGASCFYECKSLRGVTFGSASSLERIGTMCFARSGLFDFEIPSTVGGGFMCPDGCHFHVLDGLVLSHDCEL